MRRLLTVGIIGLAACGGDSSGVDPDGGAPVDAGEPDSSDSVVPQPERYPFSGRHSPVTEYVVNRWLDIAANSNDRTADTFAKVGDSITVSQGFFSCFDGGTVDLDGRPLQGTLDYFLAGDAQGTSPFARVSLAAGVGWNAGTVLAGSPSPLSSETAAIKPRFAAIMFGTNDIELGSLDAYTENMMDVVDALIGEGTIPILSTIPPRDDNLLSDAQVPEYNAVVRGIAQSRQIPMVDFHGELEALPEHGLGPDNLHPSSFGGGACILSQEGLQHGFNRRNLLTLEALDRAKSIVIDGAPAPDASRAIIEGQGTSADPYHVDSLPFIDVRDTSTQGEANLAAYSGCASNADEGGREIVYQLDLDTTTMIKAIVLDRGDADIDVHILNGSVAESECLYRDNRAVEAELAPGRYYVVLDSFVNGVALEGEFALVILGPRE
jgi:lysophospholipase L1-like esterase